MNKGLVCIAQFDNSHVASVARSRLQADGIRVILRNAQMVRTGVRAFIPGPHSSFGGALLYVPPNQTARAIAILQQVDPAVVRTAEFPQQPPSALRGALKVVLPIALIALLVVMLVFLASKS